MTRLLLDTHAFLWAQTNPKRLGAARKLIENGENDVMLSSISSWEIAIKWSLGKLPLPSPPALYVPDRMQSSATSALAFTHAHALRLGELPKHHHDPFDRALIAQAQSEGIALVTADAAIREYDLELVWIGPPGS